MQVSHKPVLPGSALSYEKGLGSFGIYIFFFVENPYKLAAFIILIPFISAIVPFHKYKGLHLQNRRGSTAVIQLGKEKVGGVLCIKLPTI